MEEVEDVRAEEMEELAKEMPTITQEEEELAHELREILKKVSEGR